MQRFESGSTDFDKTILSSYPLPVSIVSVPIEPGSEDLASMLATSVSPLGKEPATLTFSVQKTSGLVELLDRSGHTFLVQQPNQKLIDFVSSGEKLNHDTLCAGSTRVLKCAVSLVDDSCSNNLYTARVIEFVENDNPVTPTLYWQRSYHKLDRE